MIGFIGAMQIELDGIRALMTEKTSETVSGIEYVCGKLGSNRIVTAVCGIGKVFAAICAQTMILKYSPTLIINTGVAGAISPDLSIGDVVVAEKVLQHDMYTSPIGDPVGLISGINKIYFETDKKASDALAASLAKLNIKTLRGVIATGDQFVSNTEKKNYLRDSFGAASCEMEGGSIGHVCYVNSVPFAILRSISDNADEGATMDYPTFARTSAERYVKVVKDFAENWVE
ncbi:MAG: 5'-methylthioadenosine/adenosylhomocysteine nucleosidase [Clostridia bacterium]|nr:5'-methylthioadenosine/adenosylhomocysteine nucleosidase [Clostridia bacterium]